MPRWLVQIWDCLNGWRRAALNHAEAIKHLRGLPAWLAVIYVAFDFGLLAFWYRYANPPGAVQWVISGLILFCLRLALVIGTLLLACRHYRVSGRVLGIRPSNINSDLRWSLGLCALGVVVVGIAIVAAFIAAVRLGIHLPAPPEFVAEFLGGNRSVGYLLLIGVCGAMGILLVAVTEELIYRALFLPALTSPLGLFPAVVVTSIVFGLLHVIPFGIAAIPAPQIIGGVLFAAGFAIRWSVVPAIVIHTTCDLFLFAILFGYVRLFETHPGWFWVQ